MIANQHLNRFNLNSIAAARKLTNTEALAKLDCADEKFAMQLARIERDRVKNKLKQISEACVSVSVISR